MKIGIFSPYLNTLGGGERYIFSIASCLQAAHEVHIFWDDADIGKRAADRFGLDLTHVKVVKNIFDPSVSLLKRISAARAYDSIIVLSDGSIPFLWGTNLILHFQQPFLNAHGSLIANRIKLSGLSGVICNSFFTKEYIDRAFRRSSFVLYPPVDTVRFAGANHKKNLILSVGRIHPVKKHEVLVDSFRTFQTLYPDWQFVIAGGLLDSDRGYYEKLVKKAGKGVEILPNVSFEDLRTLYKQAALYWHAAGFGEDQKKHPERFEHFGIAPVEAMSASCIPVLLNGGGLREIAGEKENLLLWKTPDELIRKTAAIIEDSQLRSKLAQWARVKSQEFSFEHFCSKLHEIIGQ